MRHLDRSNVTRRGQVLVEFAMISLVLYMLLAAVITFGHSLHAAGGIQQAADLAAREIARTPLPVSDEYTLEHVLYGNANTDTHLATMRRRVFDEHYFVLDLETLHGRPTLEELVADLPLVNQQLFPVMISDTVEGRRVLRYPGAVFNDGDASDNPADPPPSGLLVAVPLVRSRASDGTETIDWVPVIEEIESPANPDPFLITLPAGADPTRPRGLVALRVNYPFQSAAMSSFRANPAGPFEPTIGNPNVSNDAAVTLVNEDPAGFSPSGTATASDQEFGPYTGSFGLGRQAAFGSPQLAGNLGVRPYRRLVTAQSIHRREVFGP
jgi:hypothetical protein